jgi:peptidoglycan hydrolase CwlO-like protein
VLNAALVAGAVRLHLEVRHATVPIAAISVDVKDLKADQAGVHAKLEESRAQLDDARFRLDEQRIRLDEQAAALATTAQQQKDAERDAREHEAREARDLAALTARMNRSDRRAYKLDEAIQLIDLVQGGPAATPPSGGSEEHVVPIINP